MKEVVARVEAVQEVLTRAIPLQEGVRRVVAVQEVLARFVAGWWVNGAPGGGGEAGGVIGTSTDRGARMYARRVLYGPQFLATKIFLLNFRS